MPQSPPYSADLVGKAVIKDCQSAYLGFRSEKQRMEPKDGQRIVPNHTNADESNLQQKDSKAMRQRLKKRKKSLSRNRFFMTEKATQSGFGRTTEAPSRNRQTASI
ncbi:hypothetical protein PIB30_099534 [Stylosanthes scabra]|uniref:Uncharacterized protein n=1 Tax=Stylosanthes scabra TaxID=79078 RepID=A0ABU6QWS9_9FABA|nr:hypothetical protein [Stylosanthes scabra]